MLFSALAWALLGVLRQGEIIELIELSFCFLTLDWRRTGRFRIPKKVALQGQVRLGHGVAKRSVNRKTHSSGRRCWITTSCEG